MSLSFLFGQIIDQTNRNQKQNHEIKHTRFKIYIQREKRRGK